MLHRGFGLGNPGGRYGNSVDFYAQIDPLTHIIFFSRVFVYVYLAFTVRAVFAP
jgi:hypothetical protein